jgi:hypothetical protein
MKSVLSTLVLLSSFAAYSQVFYPIPNIGKGCSETQKEEVAQASAALKEEIANKIEKSEGVRCIENAKIKSALSCGIYTGALRQTTLTVKIDLSIGKDCDATTLKVDGYKVQYKY